MSMHKGMLGRIGEPGPASCDQTLSDYIRRKNQDEAFNVVNAEKKLSFAQWWKDAQEWVPFEEHPEEAIWKAAQENCR